MHKSILVFLILLSAITGFCQTKETKPALNLDFETAANGNPTGWDNFGASDYILSLDSAVVHTGKYSVSIECTKGDPDYKAWAFTLPGNYAGKKITLTGYMKTENVTEGYAGLWMRIDPSIAFDNMNDNGVKGTTGWTKYTITLGMAPEKTEQIVVGGLLVGKGKMWLDDFTVTIDGKDIKKLQPLQKKLFPAEKDKAFDKGSGITSIPLAKNNMENLEVLGLTWGFLKYYHPNIAAGNYNWDYALFRILPKILAAENNTSRDEILVTWINGLGKYPEGKEIKVDTSTVKISPDLDWISQSGFSPALTTALLNIKNADRANEHYYVGLYPGVANPEFKHEQAYASMTYPDAGFRLLSLYRYWNIIQYYFPYKNLIEEDWKKVLEEFIPAVAAAKDETAYTLAMLALIGRVHDTHANIWGNNPVLNNYWGQRYAAADLAFVENKAVVTGFYDKKFGEESGLQIGDIITSINNSSVEAIVQEKLIYSPASNYPTQLRNIAAGLLRTNDSSITIAYSRNDKTDTKTLKTYASKDINIYSKYNVTDTCFRLINPDIAYINNGSLKTKYLPAIWDAMKNTKGLIIDNRNYPSDFPIYALSNYLMPESTPFVQFTNGSLTQPGLFTFTKPLNAGKSNRDYYKGKVVLLINEISQSSAEFHSMAYRVHPNVTVVGSTTAGADGNVSQFSLPGGISTMISGIGVYYPGGKETQRIGIVPDVELKPSIRGIQQGRDELVEKAIAIINEK